MINRHLLWAAAATLLSTGAFIAGRQLGERSPSAATTASKNSAQLASTRTSTPRRAATGLAGSNPASDAESALPDDAKPSAADSGFTDIAAIGSYEDLLNAQPDMIDAAIKPLRASTPNKPGLFALGFAGDAQENVFRNEVDFLPKLLAARFDAADRTVELVNSPYTFGHVPLATRSNLYDALDGIAAKMDRANDILLLFITSHGSHDHQLLVDMGLLPLDQLIPADLRDALDRNHITWRVIVISACYSGGFIPALREPHTLIITAAREDRTSFGCGSDSDITWFGKAFLADALNHTTDFREAFGLAKKTIAGWEKRDKETPSEPQIWEGPLIGAKLAQWRKTLPASAAQVTFEPAKAASAKGSASR